jgi:hypothetical protein
MYLRVTVNTIERGKNEDLHQVIQEMMQYRKQASYVSIEWLTSLTGLPDQLISVQRYDRLADYEASLEQIAKDTAYRALLGRLKACTVQFFRTWD